MTDYPYFKAYVANILAETMLMTNEEKGIYLSKMVMSWVSLKIDGMPDWMKDQVDDAMKKSHKMSDNAKARWAKNKEIANTDAIALPLQSNCNAEAMQNAYIEREIEREREKEMFYSAYPRKVKRPEAERAFKKAIKKTTIDVILSSVKSFSLCEDWKKEDGKFIPYPAAYLNGERWNDITGSSKQPKTNHKAKMAELSGLGL